MKYEWDRHRAGGGEGTERAQGCVEGWKRDQKWVPTPYPFSCISAISIFPAGARLGQGCWDIPSCASALSKPSHGQQMALLLDCICVLLGPSSQTTLSLSAPITSGSSRAPRDVPGCPLPCPAGPRVMASPLHQGREMRDPEALCKGATCPEVPWWGLCLETRNVSSHPLSGQGVSLLCSSHPS